MEKIKGRERRVQKIRTLLKKRYPDANCSLNYKKDHGGAVPAALKELVKLS